MVRRSSIFLLLPIAFVAALFNYYTSLNLEIPDEVSSFSPPQIIDAQLHPQRHSTSPATSTNATIGSNKSNIDLGDYLDIPIHNWKKDDPFAPQKQTGQIWRSSHKQQNNGPHWWRYSDTCFEVDNICRISDNRWFYFHNSEGNSSLWWQPSFELKYMPYAYSVRTWADTRVQIKVQSSHRLSKEKIRDMSHCELSSIPYHVVLQSVYNDMIGEFYIRTLFGFYLLLARVGNHTHEHSPPISETQYYVHLAYENKKLLDAHKLMLSGMHPLSSQSNDIQSIRWAKSAVDIVQPEDDASCQCYSKLVFCGYDVRYTHQSPAGSNSPESDSNATYSLWPSTHVDATNVRLKGSNLPCDPLSQRFNQNPYECVEFAKLKSHLLFNTEAHFPHINDTITEYRKQILLDRGLVSKSYIGDTKEWSIVGLAQRTSRRVWLNLSEVLDACHDHFLNGNDTNKTQVVCIEVNVENTTTPHEQFLLHRSLDALIGVHGAQMAQALFLPPGSHVLELLPWIPAWSRGIWTARTSIPTPIGIMFHNTDLNHYGYSLNRNSVHFCENTTSDPLLDEECLRSNDKFAWDKRDFRVEPTVVVRFIQKFVSRDNKRSCRDLHFESSEEFVLYNIWCYDYEEEVPASSLASRHDLQLVTRHFYRKETPSNPPAEPAATSLPSCPRPMHNNTAWKYYIDLPQANAALASNVRNLTTHPVHRHESNIPHRLIFTHYVDLFNCSHWESNTTSPQLYNLAENARATLNAYKKIWPDLEYKFLMDDDCIKAINETEPGLVGWFNALDGMYKADICRAAYLYLHGGYYFDVDVLVVHPYVAPANVTFVTVKGDGWPANGFFQAFLAAEKGHPLMRKSIDLMKDRLWENNRHYLGPMALMDAWMQVENITASTHTKAINKGLHLLEEVNMNVPESTKQHENLTELLASKGMMQHVPKPYGDRCQFSSGACNVIVVDAGERDETLYFYSRVFGTTWCGKLISNDCTSDN